MFVGLHVQRDNTGRMVFLSETCDGDSFTLLICRNYPYGDNRPNVPTWILPQMPVFRTNTDAEEWLRKNTNLLETEKPTLEGK